MELRGLEPLTPCLPDRCATSCATAPDRVHPPRAGRSQSNGSRRHGTNRARRTHVLVAHHQLRQACPRCARAAASRRAGSAGAPRAPTSSSWPARRSPTSVHRQAEQGADRGAHRAAVGDHHDRGTGRGVGQTASMMAGTTRAASCVRVSPPPAGTSTARRPATGRTPPRRRGGSRSTVRPCQRAAVGLAQPGVERHRRPRHRAQRLGRLDGADQVGGHDAAGASAASTRGGPRRLVPADVVELDVGVALEPLLGRSTPSGRAATARAARGTARAGASGRRSPGAGARRPPSSRERPRRTSSGSSTVGQSFQIARGSSRPAPRRAARAR